MAKEVTKRTEEYLEITDTITGVIKKIMLASDKQWGYLNNLRDQLGKIPIKNRPTVFAASKAIDKALKKIEQNKEQEAKKIPSLF